MVDAEKVAPTAVCSVLRSGHKFITQVEVHVQQIAVHILRSGQVLAHCCLASCTRAGVRRHARGGARRARRWGRRARGWGRARPAAARGAPRGAAGGAAAARAGRGGPPGRKKK
jgi:hypothetical protein